MENRGLLKKHNQDECATAISRYLMCGEGNGK